eukprot:6178578-Pleurochrysis_carterae.AAC.1
MGEFAWTTAARHCVRARASMCYQARVRTRHRRASGMAFVMFASHLGRLRFRWAVHDEKPNKVEIGLDSRSRQIT